MENKIRMLQKDGNTAKVRAKVELISSLYSDATWSDSDFWKNKSYSLTVINSFNHFDNGDSVVTVWTGVMLAVFRAKVTLL